MRELIFRGKRVDNGEWFEGCYWENQFGNHFIRINIEYAEYTLKDYEVIPETVGQYTGLTDRCGKKIFEGDIVKWVDNQTKGRCVQGAVTMFGFCWCVKNIFNSDYENWSWSNNTHEIIGNIHDNPELLEGVNEIS